MPIEITMPRVSEEARDGVLVEWRLEPGQAARAGQVVAEVETDKAIVELEAPEPGVLAFQALRVGQTVPAGGVVAVLAAEGESVEQVRARYAGRGAPEPVAGTEGHKSPARAAPAVLRAIPLRGRRGAIAERMLRSKREIPQYHVTVDCDAAGLLAARKALKKDKRTRNVNMNAILLKCLAAALKDHPMVNATIAENTIYQHAEINISVAVAAPDGVVAPVVRGVAGKSLLEISAELDALADAARRRRLRAEQLQGGTFAISTLGSYGVHHFTAIVLPPQVAILSVGAVRAEAVVDGDRVVPGQRIAMTLAADHRAVDGAVAAEFLRALQSLIEEPSACLR